MNPNADELRPIGGFVTMAGHITFDRGRIVDFNCKTAPRLITVHTWMITPTAQPTLRLYERRLLAAA
ncbi:MAG: hypothetical protein H6633_06760 [Anaerolineales bacterium]|nr:hypothetical protein [Anaerolineales bacterium]